MSKSVMKQIIEYFKPLGKWRIDHKRLWLEYLETGKLPFSSKELYSAIREIVDTPENRPRGDRLLHFHKKYNFTLKEDKTPYRPEEALERFIVLSNGDNFFNQMPVGGGKESIDIVVRHGGGSVEFVELKPWSSGDSPLYALVEGLKNLIEYRLIVERQIQVVDRPWKVDISMLAPREYYRNFLLLDDTDTGVQQYIIRATELMNELARAFDTRLSVYSLSLTANSFNQSCSLIFEQQGLVGQEIAGVTEEYKIASLQRITG